MSDLEFPDGSEPSLSDLYLPKDADIEKEMETIQNSHQLLYQMINLESWALAASMDEYIPGFWSRFIENRRQALKERIAQKRQNRNRQQQKNPPWENEQP